MTSSDSCFYDSLSYDFSSRPWSFITKEFWCQKLLRSSWSTKIDHLRQCPLPQIAQSTRLIWLVHTYLLRAECSAPSRSSFWNTRGNARLFHLRIEYWAGWLARYLPNSLKYIFLSYPYMNKSKTKISSPLIAITNSAMPQIQQREDNGEQLCRSSKSVWMACAIGTYGSILMIYARCLEYTPTRPALTEGAILCTISWMLHAHSLELRRGRGACDVSILSSPVNHISKIPHQLKCKTHYNHFYFSINDQWQSSPHFLPTPTIEVQFVLRAVFHVGTSSLNGRLFAQTNKSHGTSSIPQEVVRDCRS